MAVTGVSKNERRRPGLVVFSSGSSGRSRRVEGFLAQVLQRRANHSTFKLYSVDVDKHPELAERFMVGDVPSLFVIEDKRVKGSLELPKSCRQIEEFLAPWLH
ncbi:MAG TPA: thioredoxin family protein [Gaiellaceae bacterium]